MSGIKVSKDELRQYTRQELLEHIDEGVSVLKTLDAEPLLNQMKGSGLLCRVMLFFVCIGAKDRQAKRKRAMSLMKWLSPCIAEKAFPSYDGCVVIGFNHPSLGEIYRLLYLGFKAYPDKDFLFPVNIPWYETMVPIIPKLNSMGIYITPMVTPRTKSSILEMHPGDEQFESDLAQYKSSLEKIYLKRCAEMSEKNAVLVLAPSATRQTSVFPSEEARQGTGHIHPAMTLLAQRIINSGNKDIIFVPVRVFLPDGGNRMFNLFRKYTIVTCESFSSKEISGLLDGHSREFDYMFLKRMDEAKKES